MCAFTRFWGVGVAGEVGQRKLISELIVVVVMRVRVTIRFKRYGTGTTPDFETR